MAARISKADFDEKVLKSKLPVIVDFLLGFMCGLQEAGTGSRRYRG
mgnify:CR=1 FL=1